MIILPSRFVSWVKTQNAHGRLLWLRSLASMKRSLVKRNREFWRPETIYKSIKQSADELIYNPEKFLNGF